MIRNLAANSGLPFYIVDVFSIEKQKFTGNQLAVVRNAKSLKTAEMQRIANEMHFSETTFIGSDEINSESGEKSGGYDVRIFTPNYELKFAGHPTLGTAYVIQQEILRKPVETVKLNLGVGQIPVTFGYGQGNGPGDVREMWMKQVEPKFKDFNHSKKELTDVLGIVESDFDDRFPIQDVSTGIFTTIIPLRSLSAVKSAKVDTRAYSKYVQDRESKTLLIFSPETYDKANDLNVRVFAIFYGVPEDPATGSANGCLAAYLMKNSYFGKDKTEIKDVKVEQGYEINRPSLLKLNASANDRGRINVEVGGSAVIVVEGKLLI